ncbi:MAG: hypothetical protein KC415_04305 [Anaerolineales bacterium]|nr:hypothetical protein [Anaerolineales bacterium]MCB8983642.1 hypothetical protein [Ardenticatenaceae bacterium]
MSYQDTVNALAADAEQLELAYQAALKAGNADEFGQAIIDSYHAAPENLLYAAWYHRLAYAARQAKNMAVAWAWVIPLAVCNGLLFWGLSDDQRFMVQIAGADQQTTYNYLPTLILWAGPISAIFVLVYLTAVGRKRWSLSALIGLVPLAAAAYVLWRYPHTGTRPFQEQYLTLMVGHLPLLAWAGVGLFAIAGHRDPAARFAFLIKSLEVAIVGGLFVIAGGLFTGITVGLFSALDVEFPTLVQRLFIAGGGGLIPVVAVAIIYDPTRPPAGQAFDEGLSKLVALLMRILLPLTLLVLVVYLAFIPFNFREPFDNRDVLIIYNGMLFAVIALLVGATPVSLADISPHLARWLRRGIVAVAALALVVSLYALAAILYRTSLDRLTPNRLAFIGWNVINIGLLAYLLFLQARAKAGLWLQGFFQAYSAGTVVYALWALVMILALPWLFGIDQEMVEALPPAVQNIVYEHANPILLKCAASQHIYLLENGQKRWVDTIETFEARGYVWRDVYFVSCDDLRSIPDGTPIPADAGPPPQP